MHVSIMESTTQPFDSLGLQSISDAQAQIRAELAGRQSNYMTNMILPEIVQSSKSFPLGPECIITRDELPDQSVLVNMDLYWLISLERGCVECRVVANDTVAGKKAVTLDPRVIITRKPRRFEAYCCAVCRQNFVTVVQALLHMKAFHRQKKKILIQDQNVFHDIEKAMEVPPVPLPWYVAKRVTEQVLPIRPGIGGPASGLQTEPTTSMSSNSQSSSSSRLAISSDTEINPVTVLLQAIVKEYNKQVHMVLFGKEFTDVTIQFEDGTSLIAHLPDIANQEIDDKTELATNDKLEFQLQRVKSESEDKEACIVKASNPILAHRLIQMALKKGVAQGSGSSLSAQDANAMKGNEKVPEKEDKGPTDTEIKPCDSPISQVKPENRVKTSKKTVRFMLGSPDSDEEGSSSASERVCGRDSNSPNASVGEKEVAAPSESAVAKPPTSPTGEKKAKAKEDEGLKGVVKQLISTASKGIIAPVKPVSPVPTATSTTPTVVREEVLATAARHAQFLPKNLSVPNLSSMTVPVSKIPSSSTVTTSLGVNQGMVRVQSWGGGSDPAQRFSLSTYTPPSSANFDHMSREELRRSFAVGRSFTYAEKIKLMNKLNDEDTLITQKHVRGAGKLIEAEASRQSEATRARLSSSSSSPSISMTAMDKPLSPTVASANNKLKKVDSESGLGTTSKYATQDGRRKRKSKYDVDRFILVEEKEPKEKKRRHSKSTVKDGVRSSSEGSISDKDEEGEVADDNPPTLLDVLRTTYARNPFMPSQSMPNIPTSSVLSDSDYYGSGEWANAAMQTLKNLQTVTGTSISSTRRSPQRAPDVERNQPATDEDSDSRSSSPFVNINNSGLSSETPSMMSPFVPVTSVAKTEANSATDQIMALAQQITAEQSHLKHLPKPELPKLHRSISPLSTESEKEKTVGRPGHSMSEGDNKKYKKERQPKHSSSIDSTAKRRSESSSKSFVIAEKGDSLEFTESVSDASLNEYNEMVLKFRKNSFAGSDSGVDATADTAMDMPQLFSNSVETLMKVRYVAKIGRCRVCGFTLPLDDNNASAMKSHVMEHSLKELLQAGCNGNQLI